MTFKPVPLLTALAVGAVLWFLPAPQGVDLRGWHLLAVFVATLIGMLGNALPLGAAAVLGLAVAALTGVLTVQQSLSGFSAPAVWLVFAAFLISHASVKSGLGARIAYLLLQRMGNRTLGLGYGLVAADLVLAPMMPSNTARSGGVIFPIAKSLALAGGSDPEAGTARKLGAYLMVTAFQGSVVTSALFLTAMAANPLAQKLAASLRVQITWSDWALAALVPGIVSLLLVPWIVYKRFPPETGTTPDTAALAKEALAKLGPLQRGEWALLGTLALLLALWTAGSALWNLDATVAALGGLAVLILTGVLAWDDVLKATDAWDALLGFGALVTLTTFLNSLGILPWFTVWVGKAMQGTPWPVALPVLALVYFFAHYAFASSTAHVSAVYAPFLAVLIAMGAPPLVSALALAFLSSLCAGMTHYGTGAAAVYFGAGYVALRPWWGLGLLLGAVHLVVWGVVGSVWWKVLGLF